MKRIVIRVLAIAASLTVAGSALAQADARAAFTAGKEAFVAGNFEKAREFFASASQTDSKNPETFLWLGKSCYELGQIDEAIAAWEAEVKIAPGEAYASKMLAALGGHAGDADARLAVIAAMLSDQQFEGALVADDKLLAEKALTDPQRARGLVLRAEALLGVGRAKDVVPVIQEVWARYPKLADNAITSTLLARAYLRLEPARSAEAVALLKKVVADNAGKPAAAAAEYELIAFDLDQGITTERVTQLAKWIEQNPEAAQSMPARQRLLAMRIALAQRETPAEKGLAKVDEDVLAAAAELYKRLPRAQDADAVTARVSEFLASRFTQRKAFSSAIAATDKLLANTLPRSSRLGLLQLSAQLRSAAAIADLTVALEAGRAAATQPTTNPADLLARPLPPALTDAVAAYQLLAREFGDADNGASRGLAALAENLHRLSTIATPGVNAKAQRAPVAWALAIALPVIQESSDEAAVAAATRTVQAIVDETAAAADPESKAMAPLVNARLLDAVQKNRDLWLNVAFKQVALLDAAAAAEFAANTTLGNTDKNASLTDTQRALVATLQKIVAVRSAMASEALNRLNLHLAPWRAQGHLGVAREALGELAKAVGEGQDRRIRLAVLRIDVLQVSQNNDRLTAAGMAPARKLDDDLKKILAQLYTLQRGLAEDDAVMQETRALWDSVIDLYKKLEYFDVAEAALAVKVEPAVPAADAYALFNLSALREMVAGRDLQRRPANRDAFAKLAVTPQYKAAIESYQKFLADYPNDVRVPQAAAAVFRCAKAFEERGALDAASSIFRDFAAFAAAHKPLNTAAPGDASVADRASFAAASVLESKATIALTKTMAAHTPEMPAPAKVSDEYAAAIAAYVQFVKSNPQVAFVGSAVQRVMAGALAYARVDAWDVADGIYRDLSAAGLPIRNPERLDMCRALCQLGKAMPDHAREVINVLTYGPTRTGAGGESTVAMGGTWDGAGGGGGWNTPSPTTSPALALATFGPPKDKGFDGKLDFAKPEVGGDDVGRINDMALATIRQQESQRSASVARLLDREKYGDGSKQRADQGSSPGHDQRGAAMPAPIFSDAELKRLDTAIDAAYVAFTAIRAKYADSPTAEQARGEILVMTAYWRSVAQFQRAAALGGRFMTDNPADAQLSQLRLQAARDLLGYSAQPLDRALDKQAMLVEVTARFEKARQELLSIIASFPDDRDLVQQAQWDIASSFLAQARVVDGFSPTMARGQYVRAARELQRVAGDFHDHPNIANIPQMLWTIGQELSSRSYYEEAIMVWNDLIIFDPASPQAMQAAMAVASLYQSNLNRPLRAVETYLEINFARGGADPTAQAAIFNIGQQLKEQKRWVEGLHVLEVFVDSFPRHPSAGLALTMIGQIHQANEAWDEAIAAYHRVIVEFNSGAWVQEARWSIAECTINLSHWPEASVAYEEYIKSYPKDPRIAEAQQRIQVLKDLARYQALVDEPGQRKAFDAQFQIGAIVRKDLNNRPKAIIEFRKVYEKFAKSSLADDALLAIGQLYLEMGEPLKARDSLNELYAKYPDSNLADDALVLVGRSYEDEAQRLAGLTRDATMEKAQETAQKAAYSSVVQSRSVDVNRRNDVVNSLRQQGKKGLAELEEARNAGSTLQRDNADFESAASWAQQATEALSANQLADRQDRTNAALRKAVEAYANAAKVPGADKAGEAILREATIQSEQLHDDKAALATWQDIVRQFPGTAQAEEASWRVAEFYEKSGQWQDAIEAYKAFLRNYRGSARAAEAQFSIAEVDEHLNKWVEAMDAYTNYVNNFPGGPLVQKAREQINWIKLYRAE